MDHHSNAVCACTYALTNLTYLVYHLISFVFAQWDYKGPLPYLSWISLILFPPSQFERVAIKLNRWTKMIDVLKKHNKIHVFSKANNNNHPPPQKKNIYIIIIWIYNMYIYVHNSLFPFIKELFFCQSLSLCLSAILSVCLYFFLSICL